MNVYDLLTTHFAQFVSQNYPKETPWLFVAIGQVRRSDQTETRMCNWRKTLEAAAWRC